MAAWAAGFARHANLSASATFGLQLCLEEAVSNIIRHGVAPAERPEILVMLAEGRDHVTAEIEDEGQPFDPGRFKARRPAPAVEEGSGFGIPLMQRFAAAISYERSGTRNRLILTFDRRSLVERSD
jgi:anti-sigma regulatory factor (Ser/Thr protein kinase)